MERVAVFCSSHEGASKAVLDATQGLGKWIGYHKFTLVYGGVNKGLMEVLAKSVHTNGGRVLGVIPDRMSCSGLESENVDISFPVVDLADRKSTMLREADVFVALPGGIGTLDELFFVLASSLVGEHSKRVVLFNVEGHWDSLIALLRDYEKRGFAYPGTTDRILVVTDAKELDALL